MVTTLRPLRPNTLFLLLGLTATVAAWILAFLFGRPWFQP